jgi:hypothetical protein
VAGGHVAVGSIVLADHCPEIRRTLSLKFHLGTALGEFRRAFDLVGHHAADTARFIAAGHRDFRVLGNRLFAHDFNLGGNRPAIGLVQHGDIRIRYGDGTARGGSLAHIWKCHALSVAVVGCRDHNVSGIRIGSHSSLVTRHFHQPRWIFSPSIFTSSSARSRIRRALTRQSFSTWVRIRPARMCHDSFTQRVASANRS